MKCCWLGGLWERGWHNKRKTELLNKWQNRLDTKRKEKTQIIGIGVLKETEASKEKCSGWEKVEWDLVKIKKRQRERADNEIRESGGRKVTDTRMWDWDLLCSSFSICEEKQSYSLKLSFILFCKTPPLHSTVSQTCWESDQSCHWCIRWTLWKIHLSLFQTLPYFYRVNMFGSYSEHTQKLWQSFLFFLLFF